MNLTELDYYNILNVARNATKEEILISYRKLAAKLCPQRDVRHERDFGLITNEDQTTHMSPLPLTRQWEYINMACDILGNDLRRSIYDRFGESGLLQGILLPNGYFPPYQYHGDHMRVYCDVFASYSPYANVIDSIVGKSPPLYNNQTYGIGVKTKDPPVIKQIDLELEDVYHGCMKLMHLWRQEFVGCSDVCTEKRKKILKLQIPPGVRAGTQYCFSEEGDRNATKIPSDIIFIVQDKPHKIFKRIAETDDLLYIHEVTLCQALTGFHFTLNTLDGRQLKVYITDVVHPGFTKRINGEGLPRCNKEMVNDSSEPPKSSSEDFGDLVIRFQIIFPKYLSKDMKRLTRKYFADLSAIEQQEADKNSGCH
uniref:J domain-containing protein n=1 Tax=Stomoxys calcitrans TaxID=35570 RepID=A0A1I8PB49_STOCA